MDAIENKVRVLEQEIETLELQVARLLETVEALTEMAERRSNEEQEYVPGRYQGPEFA